jgi:hypothetical protein
MTPWSQIHQHSLAVNLSDFSSTGGQLITQCGGGLSKEIGCVRGNVPITGRL